MKTQKEIFDFIAARFRTKSAMLEHVAGLFCVNVETVSKWSYGTTILGADRLKVLVDHFQLQPNDLFSSVPDEVPYAFMPVDMSDLDQYFRYITGMADRIEYIAGSAGGNISFIGDDVPIFHFMPFTHLTYFKLYSYAYDMLKFKVKYEEFVGQLEKYDLKPVFDRIAAAYEKIASVEIWDDYVLDAILFQIGHMDDLGLYTDPKSKKMIMEELLKLIKNFKAMAMSGKKSSGAKFEFYRKEVLIRMGYMLVDNGDDSMLSIKLDTINSMSTRDHRAIDMFSRSFRATLDKSLLVGIGAERERTIYFRKLIEKIDRAMKAV